MTDNFFNLLSMAISYNQSADQSVLAKLLEALKNNVIADEEQKKIYNFLKYAAQTSHQAIYIHGLFYLYGYIVPKDATMSFLLMREAASKGNSRAIYMVGHYYLHGIGVDQNYKNAFEWLQLAAGSPHYIKEAMQDLSMMYSQGLGVDADQETAVKWQNKAALKNNIS